MKVTLTDNQELWGKRDEENLIDLCVRYVLLKFRIIKALKKGKRRSKAALYVVRDSE